MFRSQGNGSFEVLQRLALTLFRQAEHQVKIDIVKVRLPRHGEGAAGIGAAVDAAKPDQGIVIETLRPDGEPIDSRAAVPRKPPRFGSPRIGFEGDLRFGRQEFALSQARKQPSKGIRLKKARRSPAEEDCFNQPVVFR